MRIEQCYSAFGRFGRDFRQKYGLKQYKDKQKPAIFYGLYGAQVNTLLRHQGFGVVLWAGSDALYFKQNAKQVEAVRNRPNTFFIAKSKFIAKDMEEAGFDHHYIPITTQKNDDIEECPLGDAVYIYKPNSLIYGRPINLAIMKEMSDIPFIKSGPYDNTRQGILDIYKNSFIGLRFTKHDGFAHTVLEMNLMGRPTIWNGGTPGSIPHVDLEETIATIRRLYENRAEFDYAATARNMRMYLDITDDFLYEEFYK